MTISIIGARQHNLKNICLDIPRNQLVTITGVSGSGKSSLVFDTIFSEGQREYLESLSTFARRYLPKVSRPDVDEIRGLSPTILINQKPLGQNPRSTVGTATEIYTLLRLLFSRAGTPILSAGEFSFNTSAGACQQCDGLGLELCVDLDILFDWNKSLSDGAIKHRTWKVGSRYWNIIKATNFFDMDKPLKDFSQEDLHNLLYSEPKVYKNNEPGYVQSFSFEGIVSRLLKRQSDSRGLEINSYDQSFLVSAKCTLCQGSRLNERARSVRLNGRSMVDLSTMPIVELNDFLKGLQGEVSSAIVPPLVKSIDSLISLGLGYLSLDRSVSTLSGGESQRIKLARQLTSSLTQLIYILDEPTTGLHPRDVEQLAKIILSIKDKPNTIIVVEHDLSFIRYSDYIIELGPSAGSGGGEVVAEGKIDEILSNPRSITAKYLNKEPYDKPSIKRRIPKSFIELKSLKLNNLKNIDVFIPLKVLVCLTGVSGAGKSSLVELLIRQDKKIITVDQSPIGQSPRSNPATYSGVFDEVRNELARATSQPASLFSFNSDGACLTCKGLGYEEMDMHFLDSVRLLCEDCKGKRYNDLALKHTYQGKNIADILKMTISEAINFFHNKKIKSGLQILNEVGLDYLQLGQSLDTLSGGEVQRVKLAKYLKQKGNFYILDEPTTGLHASDVDRLLDILQKIVDYGNTVMVVEHNLDVMLKADWIIDLGPEGGKEGGRVVASGTPEEVSEVTTSHTGRYIKQVIEHFHKRRITN